MPRTFADIERIVERYDTATSELDAAVTGRIGDSLDASYRNLERELRRLYPTWQSDGALYAVQRRLLLMEQLGSVLEVVRPEMRGEYERLMSDALQISHESGARMADELVRSRDPGYPLQEFTTVPIEAVAAQARDGVQRLYRYNDDFKTAVSGVVEQGLIQGWGAEKVARMLRGNEQMQGQFGLAQLKSKAETIARTEIMGAFNTASQERYERNGLQVQVLNSPSERLCSFCLARHGNVYDVGQVSVPFHPRCRDILAPYNRKWAERGWTDDAAIAADKTQRLEEMAKLGTKPNYGPTYWEKRAGLEQAPAPVWKPGDAAPVAAKALTANSIKWSRPANIPKGAKLQTVDIEQVYQDWQKNGLPLDLSDKNTRERVDRLKADILGAVESGGKFTAPKLTRASAGNEFNVPPGFDITDGRHRITAFRELGFSSIKAYVDGPVAAVKPAPAQATPSEPSLFRRRPEVPTDEAEAERRFKLLGSGIEGRVYLNPETGEAVKYFGVGRVLGEEFFAASKKAGELGIGPKIISVDPDNPVFAMEYLDGYETGIGESVSGKTFLRSVKRAIDNDIPLDDLHEDNVMSKGGEVRFIDLGGSLEKVPYSTQANMFLNKYGYRSLTSDTVGMEVKLLPKAQQREFQKIQKRYLDSLEDESETSTLPEADLKEMTQRVYALLEI